VKKASFENIRSSKLRVLSNSIIILGASSILMPSVKAEKVANSSIDLKNEVEVIKQKNFKNKDNLKVPIEDSLNKGGKIRTTTSAKTILLKNISFSGNKTLSEEELSNFFTDLIGKEVTFSDLSNAALKAQSLYREKGYITTRVIIPKQDFLSGNIKIAVIESYLEDIVVTGGTEGTRNYIKYMTSSVLKNNLKNKIFKFDDLERQLLLIKKNGLGKLTSTLSKGRKVGTSLLTINIDPEPLNISAFSNTDLSENLGDYVVGLKSSYTTKTKNPLKIGTSAKYAFPVSEGLASGVVYLEKPIAKNGLSLNSIYAYSSTKTKDLFPATSGKTTNEGTSEYISLGISYPYILKRNTEVGFDISTTIQNSHQDLYQDGVNTNNVSTDRIRAVRVGLNGRKSLKRSYNTARFLYSQGFEGWDDDLNSDEQKSNLDSKADFSTYKLDLSRQQFLGNTGVILKLNASGQIASDPLPTPEKFSFGGPDYGRGFANSHIFGDEGWSSAIQLSKNIYSKNGKTISPFVWVDYGKTDDMTGDDSEKTASTYGFGVGGNFNRDATYELSMGIPGLDDSNPTKTGPDHSIFKFNLGLRF